MSEPIVIGIDLGTTNTLAYYLKNGKATPIRFSGSLLLPSVLYVKADGTLLVGKKAQVQGLIDPQNMVRSAKTYMGDPEKTWTCRGRTFTPTQVATEVLKTVKAAVLKKMKADPGTPVQAVITVPAYFHDDQTDETVKAGEAAGLEVLKIITEPMAAALAAARTMNLNEKIMVVDLGGGTFDLSVLAASQRDHKYDAIEVAGDRQLGGDDFDDLVTKKLVSALAEELGIDMSTQEASGLAPIDYYKAMERVREQAIAAKEGLSSTDEWLIEITNIVQLQGRPCSFEYTLTRDRFNAICQPLFTHVIDSVKSFVNGGKRFRKEEIGKIILAGGSCYIPKIRDDVESFMGMKANTELPLDTLVAIGACYMADHIANGMDSEMKVQDILSHSLGVEAYDTRLKHTVFSTILSNGTPYPTEQSKNYTTVEDDQTEIPVEVYEAADENALDDLDRQHYLGRVTLSGIRPMKAGKPTIRVTFRYDANRVLRVSAEDMDQGIKEDVVMEKTSNKPTPPAQSSAPIDFVLMLDTSGSMRYEGAIEQAKEACHALVDDMIDFSVHRMGFLTFNSQAHVHASLTNNRETLRTAIESIERPINGTNMIGAFTAMKQMMEQSPSGHERVGILVSDGGPDRRTQTTNFAAQIRKDGIRLVAIGAGDDINETILDAIASPGDAYAIDDMSQLKETFHTALLRIMER